MFLKQYCDVVISETVKHKPCRVKWTEVCDPSVHPCFTSQVMQSVFDPELPGQTITRSEGPLRTFHSFLIGHYCK